MESLLQAMEIKSDYLIASFFSFLIHAMIILFLMDFFYSDKQSRPVLSKAVDVSLVFKEDIAKLKTSSKPKKILVKENPVNNKTISEEIVNTSSSNEMLLNLNELIDIDKAQILSSEENEINEFSKKIINLIESAWLKPKNIQDGLICDLRLSINRNGRITSVDLIRSSGNIRFDNSALKAVYRVESFNFYNKISSNLYTNNFKKMVITFNPS
ncbi:TonB C-terminal domain-containing protein [Gammaproteobacteria bacterium]|nr:TonB C-terminal domain-containing protein [Gammaproteobacteria bacterium]